MPVSNGIQYPVIRPSSPNSGPGWSVDAVDGMNCEYLSEYEHGELCPIIHDDILCGPDLLHQHQTTCSFTVIGKLGRGSYSNVWLGKDLTCDRYLALKVLRRQHSAPDNSEMEILKKLGKLQVAFFHTHPPNGFRYLCLGLKPLGATMRAREEAEIPPPGYLKGIVEFMRTLVSKVIAFHKRGICHGDISPGNVALGVHKDAFTPEALKAAFRREYRSYTQFIGPVDPPPPRPPHLRKYIVQTEDIFLRTDDEDMSKVDILDFGSAFEGNPKGAVHGTERFVAPERRKGKNQLPASAKTDLWSLGCILVNCVGDRHLFGYESVEAYLDFDSEGQMVHIDRCLLGNQYLRHHPEQRWFVAYIIHSLVQVDQTLRDAKKTMDLIDEFQRDGPELDKV